MLSLVAHRSIMETKSDQTASGQLGFPSMDTIWRRFASASPVFESHIFFLQLFTCKQVSLKVFDNKAAINV